MHKRGIIRFESERRLLHSGIPNGCVVCVYFEESIGNENRVLCFIQEHMWRGVLCSIICTLRSVFLPLFNNFMAN